MEHYVIKKTVLKNGTVLRLWFQDGSVRDLDMIMEANRGGVFSRLLDAEYVRKMKPSVDGYILEFPDGVTWSAQVCWLEGVPVQDKTAIKPAPHSNDPLFRPRHKTSKST
jgi:hypothetical protein